MKGKHLINNLAHTAIIALWCGCFLAISASVYGAGLESTKQKLRKQYPEISMINVSDLHERLSKGNRRLVLLDTRKEREYAVSHIRNAVNAPDIQQAIRALESAERSIEKDDPIIVYCSLGYRSARLAKKLEEAGYTNVVNVEGSLFEWVERDYPVYRGNKRVYEVHPYNPLWASYLRKDFRAYRPSEYSEEPASQ